MYRYNDFARVLATGAPLGGATIRVTLAGTLTDAVLWSDDGVTPLGNPFTAGADGAFSFYAADDRYDVTISKAGAVSYTVSDVSLGVALTAGRVRAGSFAFDAHHTTTVAEAFVTALSQVLLFPANAPAANLLVAHPVYVDPSLIVPGVSFDAKTADGVVATGAEVFTYLVVN